MVDIEDIKQRVADKVDECEFVESLGITIHELMEAFPDKMIEHLEDLGVEDMEDESD